MNQAVNMMISQQVRQHQDRLSSWARQVQAARSARDAFQLAAHAPVAPSLARSLRSVYGRDESSARSLVERTLERHVEAVTSIDEIHLLMRQAQGHWPKIWHELDRKRRAMSKT